MSARPVFAIALAAILAGCFTVVVTVLPTVDLAYRSPSAHVAIETVAAVIALVTAYLLYGRVRNTKNLRDVVLLAALALLAGTNLVFSAIPAAIDEESSSYAIWSAVPARALAAAGFAAAAFAPVRKVADAERAVALTLAACLGLILGCALFGALGSGLDTGIESDLSPESSNRPRIVGAPGLLAAQLAGMALFGVAAVGFARRVRQERDPLMGWLGVGVTLAAFSRLNYFLFPSIFSSWIYTGDVLRLGFYLVLLGGVLKEIGAYQRDAARTAVLEERRRMARDLHDGLAQDLVFISSESRRLAEGSRDARFERLASAAERALDESRDAINALVRTETEPLRTALEGLAETVAARSGVRVTTRLAEIPPMPPAVADHLLKIAREAMSNAVRHGGAGTIELALDGGADLRLRIRDDGEGFDVDGGVEPGQRSGFGLASMRERAARVGGRVEVRSDAGKGTEIEVVIPWKSDSPS